MDSLRSSNEPWLADARQDAGTYDEDLSAVYELSADLVDLLDPEPGERIADVGCGTGHLTAGVAERGADVVGVDRAATMVERARAEHPDVSFVRGDVRALPFDGSLDAVFSNAALHWVDDQDAALASIRDALRPAEDAGGVTTADTEDLGGVRAADAGDPGGVTAADAENPGGVTAADAGDSGDPRAATNDGSAGRTGGRLVAELGGTGNVAAIRGAVRTELEARGYDVEYPWYFPSPGEYATRLEEHGFEIRYLRLFDRPTPIDGGEDGLATWLELFGDSVFEPLSADERAAVVDAVEDRLREALFDPERGQWVGDYRRLRVDAVRQ